MYKLLNIREDNLEYIVLENKTLKSKARLCLNLGGRLDQLICNGNSILPELDASTYKDDYASAILFPFANRIKDGEYTFNGVKYKFYCNEPDNNNALHGLVYNASFACIKKDLNSNYGSVTLQYKADGSSKGFPYKYTLELTYKLNKTGLNLSIKVVNDDEKTFPFTLGWHPYFKTKNLNMSAINFKSNTKYVFDEQQIISGSTSFDADMPFQLKDLKLDDCFQLNSNEINFLTPSYNLKLTSTSKENFLQLYTPDQPNIIAIEPMTGVADNFNNHIGLQKLNPNKTVTVEWNLTIKTQTLTN